MLLLLVSLSSCVNPSMERGFASISESLLEVAEDLTFYAESIIKDLAQIEEDLSIISSYVDKMVKDKELALILISEILEGLGRVQENVDKAATSEQMQDLLVQVEEMGEGIRVLWNMSDFDADGIINGLDKCLETPYGTPVTMYGCPLTDTDGDGILNDDDQCDQTWGVEVDENGCEIVETGTSSSTTVTQTI